MQEDASNFDKVPQDSMRFLYKNEIVTGDDTPEGFNMEDKDELEVLVEQVGG